MQVAENDSCTASLDESFLLLNKSPMMPLHSMPKRQKPKYMKIN